MVKRPGQKLADDVVDRAVALRRAGKSYREIAGATGASLAALHAALKTVIVEDCAAALSADDAVYVSELAQLQRDAIADARGLLANLGLRIKLETVALQRAAGAGGGKLPKRTVTPRDLAAVKDTIVELRKLEELTRGGVTSRTETIHRVEPEPSPEEKAEMDRLNRLMEGDPQ